MTAEELQAWLEEHVDEIFVFMDYEPTIESEEDLAEGTLRYWFDREDWNDGQRFLHLGIDGMGSQIAVWLRPGADRTPVVYFGSEGGRGVLVQSPRDWALAIGHAPMIDEYPGDDQPSALVEGDWDEDDEDARKALANYTRATQRKFGQLPSLESLTSDLEELNREFLDWVESRLKG